MGRTMILCGLRRLYYPCYIVRRYPCTRHHYNPAAGLADQLREEFLSFIGRPFVTRAKQPPAAKGYDVFKRLLRSTAFVKRTVEGHFERRCFSHQTAHQRHINITLPIQRPDNYAIDTQLSAPPDLINHQIGLIL